MKAKFTILLCALFVLGVTVSQANAEGHDVGVKMTKVVQYGNNQLVGDIFLQHTSGEADLDETKRGDSIHITFGGMTITSVGNAHCQTSDHFGGNLVGEYTDSSKHDDYLCFGDTNVGIPRYLYRSLNDDKDRLTFRFHTRTFGADASNAHIVITGVRVDVSGLAEGEEVMAQFTTSSGGGAFDFTQSAASATRTVATVETGLLVDDVTAVNQLVCNPNADMMPSVTVQEGFASAWDTNVRVGGGGTRSSTQVMFKVADLPAGVTLVWPGDTDVEDNPLGNPGSMAMHDPDVAVEGDERPFAMLMHMSTSADTSEATYEYRLTSGVPGNDHKARQDSFMVMPQVMIDSAMAGTGMSTVWVRLGPMPMTGDDDDRSERLSYSYPMSITKDDGMFLTATDCITYLLFPWLACSVDGWETGIAISNTTKDDGIFALGDGTPPQSGSVMAFAYPSMSMMGGMMDGDMMMGDMAMNDDGAYEMMITPNLMAGDSVAFDCGTYMPGFMGYGIVRANFLNAHALAIFTGDFDMDMSIDTSHGYLALVIPEPSVVGAGEVRGSGYAESLGQ